MKAYYPIINLLRGVAALSVCVFHFVYYNDANGSLFEKDSAISYLGSLGINGVFIFFVISGFVIPLSLSKSDFKLNQLFKFLLKRFIRIEIPYICSILLILFVGYLFAEHNNQSFSVNAKQFFYHITYLIPFSKFQWYNAIYWTLAIEFQFYILIGFLYIFLSSKNKYILYSALILFGLSNFLVDDNRFVFNYSTLFLNGILLFLIEWKRIDSKIGFILIVLCSIVTLQIHSFTIAFSSILTVLAIYFLKVDNRFANRFGDISYSLYLTHGLIGGNVIYLLFHYATSLFEKVMLVLLSILISFVFSYIFWKVVENPAKKLSKKLFYKN